MGASYDLIHPSLETTQQEFCERNMGHNPRILGLPRLGSSEMAAFKTILTYKQVKYKESKVLAIQQLPGDVMTVPPGWLYQVATESPSVVVSQSGINSVHSLPAIAAAHTLGRKYPFIGSASGCLSIQKVAFNFAKGHP